MGKLFERVIERRLRHHVEENSFVSGTQFDFMRRRSVEDAITAVVIRTEEMKAQFKYVRFLAEDIQRAFDNTLWPAIMKALAERGVSRNIWRVISDLLNNSEVTYSSRCWTIRRKVNRGCP